jgi:hypothetical protein
MGISWSSPGCRLCPPHLPPRRPGSLPFPWPTHRLEGSSPWAWMHPTHIHVGAVLQQQVGQHWLSLRFYGKKLSKTEVNYSTFDRELMEGRPFQLCTEHKPLLTTLTKGSLPSSGC